MSENLQWAAIFVLTLIKGALTLAVFVGLALAVYSYFALLSGNA